VPLFRALFGDTVSVAEMDPRQADPDSLTPDELAIVSTAVDSRRREFAAGRLLARRLLGELGVARSHSLLSGAKREPMWPEGIVGSITHKTGWAGVAVARAHVVRSLGCDLEDDDPLKLELWRRILSPAEQQWLKTQPNSGQLAKVYFSAKECFYKAQFPLTRQWLGFLDVELRLQPPGVNDGVGAFTVRPQVELPALAGLNALSGRYVVSDGYVATALTVT
jgi:4'-phosphopantetheinyl transferase EntD